MPDEYAVVGNPVAHSKSPLIHAEFARQTGQNVSYRALESQLDEFEAVVERFRAGGGRGVNVTLPFKHRAYTLAQERTPRASQAQAVNTLTFNAGRIAGDNSDGIGLVRDIAENLGHVVRARRILLMGAGGAAYGVCGPLLDEEPAALVVANRTIGKAAALCAHFRRVHERGRVMAAAGYADLPAERFDIVINATSAGLDGAMPPLRAGVFEPHALAYEMVYGKATPFLQFARREGARATDGAGMLVEQAAESFYVWRGVRPDTAPVIALIRNNAQHNAEPTPP